MFVARTKACTRAMIAITVASAWLAACGDSSIPDDDGLASAGMPQDVSGAPAPPPSPPGGAAVPGTGTQMGAVTMPMRPAPGVNPQDQTPAPGPPVGMGPNAGSPTPPAGPGSDPGVVPPSAGGGAPPMPAGGDPSGIPPDPMAGEPAAASPCTGKPGRLRGKSDQTVMAAGNRRNFVYYAPASLDPNKPVPFVIAAHGANMSGEDLYQVTRYTDMADSEGFVVAFPTGLNGGALQLAPWNVGTGVCGIGALVSSTTINDQAMLDALLEFAAEDQCIDREHVFMTGFSMGGYLSNTTGCNNPNIRAIAPHSGGSHDLKGCPEGHKPAIVFHVKTDALVSYTCGAEAAARWVAKNGCSPDNPDVVEVKGGQCEYYTGCPMDGQVAFCSFERGDGEEVPTGHGWAGGVHVGYASFAAISNTASANEIMWDFFKTYAW